MVRISKEESIVVRKRVPDARITIVNKASSHKKYYVDETWQALKCLAEIRGVQRG